MPTDVTDEVLAVVDAGKALVDAARQAYPEANRDALRAICSAAVSQEIDQAAFPHRIGSQ